MAPLPIQAGRGGGNLTHPMPALAVAETGAAKTSRTLCGRPVILARKLGVRATMLQVGSMACLRKFIHFH
jgi:hypothetical protein